MTAIAEPSVATTESPARSSPTPADGLELLGEVHGSGYRDGACLVRRADGQMVQLGPLMFALLECADGRRDAAALACAMSEKLGRKLEPEHVARLAEKLAEQGLLSGSEHKAPPKSNPLLALRFKYLVTDPKITQRITRPFTGLFQPLVLWPVVLGFLAVCWFVLLHKGIASATAEAFHKPELLLLVLALVIASAAFHEVGHAAACRYGGGKPGGMGVGLYLVWPAFYTDVTDAYRLPKRDRLRVDLGGLYFNAVVAVVTLTVWLAIRVDALLLLIGLQLLTMVKQLSPMIRSDGYHVLSDATGVPDLYAHIGPTMKRLLPGHRKEPSALTGRARALVTAWVLVIVPVLLSLSLTAILLFPKIAASAWESGSRIAGAIPDQAGDGDVLGLAASVMRLIALLLPVLGTIAMGQGVLRLAGRKAGAWSDGRPGRRAALGLFTAGLACLLLWAWWPSGQYEPIRASDNGTLLGLGRLLSRPQEAVRPAMQPAAAHLAPGKHLAVAMIPRGGASRQHPAFFMIKGRDGEKPVMIVTDQSPDPRQSGTPSLKNSSSSTSTGGSATTTTAPATPAPGGSSTSTTGDPVTVAAFPFQLPDKPRPQDSQALAVNTKDGAVKYDVVYSIVTVTDGKPVDSQNTAYAFANCNACTTYAVSFQLVLIVGTSQVIAPINFAGALNGNCPACVTLAIADQIVVTLKEAPSDDLLKRLNEELAQLDAIKQMADSGASPEEVAGEVLEVQHDIETELDNSGLLVKPLGTSSTGTSTSTSATTTPTTTQPTTTSGTSTTDGSTTTTTDSGTTTTPSGTSTTPTETSTSETTTTDTSTTETTTPDTTTTETTATSTTTTSEPTP
jgi:putative peptide zinc metalloprotease protein